MKDNNKKISLHPSLLLPALTLAGIAAPPQALAALKPLLPAKRPAISKSAATTVHRPAAASVKPGAVTAQSVNGILVHMRNNTPLTQNVLANFEKSAATRLTVASVPANGQYVLKPASATTPAQLAAATTKLRANPNVLSANLYVK